ncbi:MAG: MFS transporter [Nocardioidaceae bacterium]
MGGLTHRTEKRFPRLAQPAPTLFLAMFAGQAGFLVLAPILPDVSHEFGVSTAAAGQLRLVSGIAGGLTAIALAPLARRLDLRGLLSLGLSLLATGSLASAAAPSFTALAGAQVAIGSGLGIVVSAAIAAAAEWAGDGDRARVLSWALVGQPAAWVAGMPAIGAIAEVDWRLTWLAVPFAASVLALGAVRRRRPATSASGLSASWRPVWRDPAVAGWAIGELFAFAAWGGTLVFSGALFLESYEITPGTVGLLLAAGAAAYFPGNFLARRWVARAARPLLVGLALLLAAGVAAFGAVRPGLAFSGVLFAALVCLAGGRTMAGSAIGLDAAPEHKLAVTSMRAAATQFGYLLGAGAAGAALAAGGYAALGAAQATLFVAAAVPHVLVALSTRIGRQIPALPHTYDGSGVVEAGARGRALGRHRTVIVPVLRMSRDEPPM